MFKSFAAAALAALSIASFTPAAVAETRFQLFIGGGGYGDGYGYGDSYSDDCVWIGHRYRCHDRPVIEPFIDSGLIVRPHHRRRHNPDIFISRMSCDTAVELLQDRGFYRIRAKDCKGSQFEFSARRDGKRYYITVSSSSGRVKASRI